MVNSRVKDTLVKSQVFSLREPTPWFVITTKIGRFKVGWRKRVIEIDWSQTIEPRPDGNILFKDENVTVGETYVHAWTYEKMRAYIKKILEYPR
jgi:hypothetical protein